MKTFTKILTATAAATALLAGASAASAAQFPTNINSALLNLAGSSSFAMTVVDEPGAFSHVFEFTVDEDSTSNGSVTTQILGDNDIDFTSIFLDGFAFTQTGFDANDETWALSAVKLSAGLHTLTLNGFVAGASGDGAYGGNINIAAVPEPATWALMIMGFGSAGYMIRRRRTVFA